MIKVKLNDAIEYIKGKPNKKSNEVFRHSKYGRQLIAQAQSQGATTLQLHAQLPAVPFYQHFGFQTLGAPFLEADLQHILMQRNC